MLQRYEIVNDTQARDFGCTFSPITCSGCNNVLGKMYRTTPSHLDHLRYVHLHTTMIIYVLSMFFL